MPKSESVNNWQHKLALLYFHSQKRRNSALNDYINRGVAIEKSYYRVNERIRAAQVRVIDDNGAQIGILGIKEALAMAQEKELDLIEVAPDASPPVCRIMDYGKYKYALSKKEHEQRKKHKSAEMKAIRLRPNISGHDLEVKAKRACEFLQDGHKVRFNLLFKSREMSHPEIGRQVLEKIADMTTEYGIVEARPRIEGRMFNMILAPKPGQPSRKKEQNEQQAKPDNQESSN